MNSEVEVALRLDIWGRSAVTPACEVGSEVPLQFRLHWPALRHFGTKCPIEVPLRLRCSPAECYGRAELKLIKFCIQYAKNNIAAILFLFASFEHEVSVEFVC